MHHMYNNLNPTGILVGIVIGFFIGYWFRKKEESSSLGTKNVPSQNEVKPLSRLFTDHMLFLHDINLHVCEKSLYKATCS